MSTGDSDPEALLRQALRAQAGGPRPPEAAAAAAAELAGRSGVRQLGTAQVLLIAAIIGLVIGMGIGLAILLLR